MEKLEELFLKLSGKDYIEFTETFGGYSRGALEASYVEGVLWETLLTRNLSTEEIESGKKSSEIIPTGKITSLRYATSFKDKSVVDTKIYNEPVETIDQRIDKAIRLQEITRRFLKDRGEEIAAYVNTSLPVNYSRSEMTIDGEEFSLIISEPPKKYQVTLRSNIGEGLFHKDFFKASTVTVEDLEAVLPPLNYHIERFKEAVK